MRTAKSDLYRGVKYREGAFPERFAKVRCHGDKTAVGAVDQKIDAGFLSIDFLNKGSYSIVIALIQYTRFDAACSPAFSRFLGESVEGVAIAGRRVDFAAFLAGKGQGNPPAKSARSASDNTDLAYFVLLDPRDVMTMCLAVLILFPVFQEPSISTRWVSDAVSRTIRAAVYCSDS